MDQWQVAISMDEFTEGESWKWWKIGEIAQSVIEHFKQRTKNKE